MTAKKSNYIEFLKIVGKSKRLPRTGWVREGIKNPESVAEHSFRVGVLAMILSEKLGVDKDKMMKMALIHDLGETFTGDIVWTRGNIVDIKTREEKERQELRSLIRLFDMIENHAFIDIFEEMIEGVTNESKIFWQIDRLEMALQAFEYEEETSKNLEEFFINADLFIQEPILRKIFDEIIKVRVERRGLKKHESI